MNVNTDTILFAFALTLFAGLSTGIGSALAFFTKRTNTKVLSIALGFSAGVMIYVSFMEIIPKATSLLSESYGENIGTWSAIIAFFVGILLIALIDRFIPSYENPHEIKGVEDMDKVSSDSQKLKRMGMMSAIAIAIHNFPEGMATFAAAMAEPELAIPVAIAIAIHNIPEGIAVSVPLYYATGSRKKAFWLSFSSGMAEPVGAIVAFLILLPFMSPALYGALFGLVGGIMVFISLDELLPAAERYGKHHYSIWGVVLGMMVMAASLLLLK